MDRAAIRAFRKLCLATLIAVYVLIGIGAVVRTTGSGMGCPDWPKCFGRWTPPSSVSELPENYKALFAASREKKNARFAAYLKALGFPGTAGEIAGNKSVQTETEFNVTKAWIEYGNRIVGVIIGFMIVLLFGSSLKFVRHNPSVFYLALLTLIAVIVQGWFGSIVVSTNLTSWTVTLHMFLALLIVVFLVRLLSIVSPSDGAQAPGMSERLLLAICILVLLIQILLGTKVRTGIDEVSGQLPRSQWIDAVGLDFIIHRSFSLMVVFFHGVLWIKLDKTMRSNPLPRALIMIILGTLLTGMGMAWMAVPAVLQPLHLLFATSAFGVQLYLFYRWAPSQGVSVKEQKN